MKKNLLILSLLLFSYSIAQDDMLILPEGNNFSASQVQEEANLINVDSMKKSKKIKKVRNEILETEKPKINIDMEQINHQRALNYTTRTNNSMLPRF